MLTDAFAPGNFLLTNPAALREAARHPRREHRQGRMENFAEDLGRGGGQLGHQLRPTTTMFTVGENVATAPGKVIFQNDIIQILQFAPPARSRCIEIPLLIFPPWINKFYILDLRPGELDDPLA